MSQLALTRISCGIHQLHGLDDNPEEMLKYVEKMFTQWYKFSQQGMSTDALWISGGLLIPKIGVYVPAMIIFSDRFTPNYPSNGKNLSEWLNKIKKYGHVHESDPVPNTNSTYLICLWTWYLDPHWIRSFSHTKNPFYKELQHAAPEHTPAPSPAVPATGGVSGRDPQPRALP